MAKKVVIVGGVAGGASVAARVRRLDESAEVIMFERGPNVSFSNCALPFFLSRIVPKSENLVLMSPEQFKKQYNIIAKTSHEVIKINAKAKTVTVKDLASGKEFEESYDTLVLSPGASPLVPKSIKGADKPHVFTVRNVVDIKKIDDYIQTNNVNDIAVIGAGYIGVETAENLRLAGKNVALVEKLNQVVAPFDYDMAQLLHKEMYDKGLNLILGDGIKEINDDNIVLESGKKVTAKAVVLSLGVYPETELAKSAGITLGETGAILVDHNYRTNIDDIYAVGDAIEVSHFITNKKTRLTLAGPAQRQARAAADDMYRIPHRNTGVIGSSVIHCFDYNAACTGLNEKDCKANGINYDYVYLIPGDKVGLMPNSNPLFFKLIFEKPSGRILGAQAIGKGNVDKRVDVIASFIMLNGTLEDLKELELCYSPMFGTAKDIVNHAALVALNILNGVFKQVPVTMVRELVEKNACIIDVREPHEFEAGHIVNAINIPLSQFRERVKEIPKDKPVYLHCRSSQRSYNAICALQGLGYRNVYNIMGSFLGLSVYEYYTDKIQNRKPIVTAYNFN
ncbi:FAD-dependent oxidoreductase [Treponema pedis]|uniref:FAD-dependent oxidoreductase n=2 Tax=Treponema pedis TaxID=409322 RepID=UPI0019820ABD|nr:FAD-dependent oxidoreductase [Treponema pedis]QSI05746.1 pyridine nucleotide-disulfide oxidoreductase [Treponema pedis]